MNALELANEMDRFFKKIGYEDNPVSPMLRKQQAIIAKMENKLIVLHNENKTLTEENAALYNSRNGRHGREQCS